MSTLELEHLKHTSSSSNNLSTHSDGSLTLQSLNVTGDLTVDTNTLKVDSSNNRVGIGTASPLSELHQDVGLTDREGHYLYYGADAKAGFTVLPNTGEIRIGAATAGTNGNYYTEIMSRNGSNLITSIKADNYGRVTMPNQPACFAFKSGSGNGTSDSGAGALNATGTNTGNHFDTSTGRFTCPVAGVYMVCWTMMNHQNNTGTPTCVLRVNGVGYKYFHVENSHPQGQSDQLVYTANANDYFDISLSNYHWNGGSQNKYPSMSVFLIG
jgi:hypothetical protein